MFLKRMSKIIILAIVSALSACGLFVIGDGAMGITGNLGSFTTDDCIAKVLLRTEREVWRFDLLPDAEGNFSHDFTVAPRSEKYKIEIECEGKIIASKTVTYPEDLENGFYLRFGELG